MHPLLHETMVLITTGCGERESGEKSTTLPTTHTKSPEDLKRLLITYSEPTLHMKKLKHGAFKCLNLGLSKSVAQPIYRTERL